MLRQYGKNCWVVFDGYSDSLPNTKSEEHRRRQSKAVSADVIFDESMTVNSTQANFLSNPRNKTRFIAALSVRLADSGINVKQAPGDADTLIVNTAIDLSRQCHGSNEPVVIIGEDTDLLVLLVALTDSTTNIFMMKPGKDTKQDKVYSANKLREGLGECSRQLLFLHAMSGCDSTSFPYRQGKKKAFKLLHKNTALCKVVDVFNTPEAKHDEIAHAGEQFFLALYGSKSKSISLDKFRYYEYLRRLPSKPVHKTFDLAVLPPTISGAKQHSFRVYHQVQQWRGNILDPLEWGWKMIGSNLLPTSNLQPPAPENLLHLVSCNCKTGCIRNCECKKGKSNLMICIG